MYLTVNMAWQFTRTDENNLKKIVKTKCRLRAKTTLPDECNEQVNNIMNDADHPLNFNYTLLRSL